MQIPRRLLSRRRSKPATGTSTQPGCEWLSPRTLNIPVHSNQISGSCSYLTEKPVGKAIAKSGVPRKDLFVTTKLWNNKHHPDDVAGALQQSLDDLGLEYVDLFLMHWPVAWQRGEELFPTKGNQFILENIDVVDVQFPYPLPYII